MTINTAQTAIAIRHTMKIGYYREHRFDDLIRHFAQICGSCNHADQILTQGGLYDYEAHAWAIASRNEIARELRVRGFATCYDGETGMPCVTIIPIPEVETSGAWA